MLIGNTALRTMQRGDEWKIAVSKEGSLQFYIPRQNHENATTAPGGGDMFTNLPTYYYRIDIDTTIFRQHHIEI